MAETSQLETAARAVHAALDYHSPPDSRLAASTFLESLKNGDVQILGATASGLVRERTLSSEIRHYGLKLLQYLVRMRWEELTVGTRAQLTDLVLGLVPEIATSQDEWFLKSQTAALVAEVVRHEDTSLWQGLLFKLMELAAVSPAYAELVAMVLRWLPEDITVYNEDLEGDRRRQLLHSLTQALPRIFPLFYKMLESHFGEAVSSLQRNELEMAKQHAAVVNATLNAVLAYMEWAPVDKIVENGLIEACGFLLNAAEFRLRSGEIMKQIASRKRPVDDSAPAFDAALRRVFEVLSQASKGLQNAPSANKEDDSEFAEYLTEALAAIGSQNLLCFVGFQDHLTAYLQQMLGFYQHSKIGVHFWALLFWLAVLRDIPSDPEYNCGNEPVAGKLGVMGPVSKDKKGVIILISDEVYASLLDHTFNWYFQNSSKVQVSGGSARCIEEISDVKDYGNYRGRLLELVRLAAVRRPYVSVIKISERIKEACGSPISSNMALGILDSAQKLLDAIIYAIFGGENVLPSIGISSLQIHLEGILSTLLMAKWSGSAFVEIHGRLLDAMGPFLKTSHAATLSVLNKMFELLTSLPMVSTSFGKDSSLIENSRSRLQVCTSFLRIAKAADKTVSAHLEAIWKTISALQEQGLLQQGEHNLIAEAFLVAGSAAGKECEAKALDCFLSPIQTRWSINNLQERFLLSPENLVALFTKQTESKIQHEELWSMFHSITFTERVVKRYATQHPDFGRGGATANDPPHPLKNHIKWIITPLLQLLRCIHALWSPKIKHSLPVMVQGALLMSSAEQASIIGEAGTKPSRTDAPIVNDMETHTDSQTGGKEHEIRNWLKGVRDSRLVMQHHSIAKASLSICIQALKWPDTEAVHKALVFCGATVTVATISGNNELQNYVATDLFTAIIEALTIDSNASAQAELINLFRIIYLLMAQQHAAPRQILQSSPSITAEVLSAFENALSTTSSPKEHRQYIKSLLLQAGGGNIKALMALKSPNSSITNVTNRPRPTPHGTAIESEEVGKIGLAALM